MQNPRKGQELLQAAFTWAREWPQPLEQYCPVAQE